MKRFLPVLFVVSVLFVLSVPSSADVFNLGPGLTSLETVTVGDPGNAGELSGAGAGGYGPDRVCGAVSYAYSIGKYEITAAQYTDFLNKVAATDTYGLYHNWMWSDSEGCKIQRSGSSGSYTYSIAADWANRPVNYVSFWDSCRFANWLHNGQPTGLQNLSTTEDGAYYLNGYTDYTGGDVQAFQRKASWKWAVTSEDEWYKAAYYKGGGGTNAGYWDYPMQGELPAVPDNNVANPDDGNNANFFDGDYSIGSPYFRTVAGEFENSESPYGTFDQGGNVWEWNEGVMYPYSYPRIRGGSFSASISYLFAQNRYMYGEEGESCGFRVVQAVPEPSSLMILAGGIGMLLGIRRRNG